MKFLLWKTKQNISGCQWGERGEGTEYVQITTKGLFLQDKI